MHTLLTVSFALLAGLLMTRLFKPFKLPSVTAFLVAGVLIGPFCLGALNIEGVGFKTADEIATRIGIRSDSDFRIRSGILYVLLGASNEAIRINARVRKNKSPSLFLFFGYA